LAKQQGTEAAGLANDSSRAVECVSGDVPQSPTGPGEGETPKSIGESAFAGFFYILSPRKKDARKVEDIAKEEENPTRIANNANPVHEKLPSSDPRGN
jgi:hypothetical protein